MRFRNTWILAGIVVAFGAYVYFGEFKKAAKEEEQKASDEKVLNLEVEKVVKLEVKNSNGDFVMSKDDKKWNLDAPLKDQADGNMISGILNALTTAKFDQTIEGEDLKQFGLDNPKSFVALTMKDGAVKKVNVGNDAPLPGKVYLQRDGEKKVLFSEASFKTQLDRSLRDFRDKKIFRKDKGDIQSVIGKYYIHGKTSGFGLIKKSAGWEVVGKENQRADQDAVNSFLTSIDNLRATDFPSEKGNEQSELKKYGLDKPEIAIHLEDKDLKGLADILISAKRDNNVFVKVADSPVIYQGFAGVADQLNKTEEDFKDKKEPFDIKKDDVNEIILEAGNTNEHIIKKDTNWVMTNPDPKKEVSQIQVNNFLDKVANLRVSETLPGKAWKEPAKGTMVLKDAKGQTLLTVRWEGDPKTQRSYLTQSSKVKYLFGTDTTALNGLTGQPMVLDKTASLNPSVTPGPTPGSSKPGLPAKPEIIDLKPAPPPAGGK